MTDNWQKIDSETAARILDEVNKQGKSRSLFNKLYDEAQYTESKLKELFEDDDPIIESIDFAVNGVKDTLDKIEEQIKIRAKK